jgi:rhodanese-related sulfurtransferase
MALPDHVAVWPTHGAGSFCSSPPGSERTSTIGQERATNALLAAASEDEFVTRLLGSLGSFPTYFRWLGETNRRGPAVLPEPLPLAPLTVAQVRRLIGDGATIVDVRPIKEYAAAHIPGSLSIELRSAFGTWLGWLLPEDAEIVVLRSLDQDPAEILGQATKVGYDIAGELAGGIPAWTGADLMTTSTALVTPSAMSDAERVLDIRQDSEFAAGHVPGAEHSELGSLPNEEASLADGPVTVMCGHGERAMSAASAAVWGFGQLGTGALSDRIGRKALIVGGMLTQAVALGIVAVSDTFAFWVVGAVLLGAGTAMVYPTLLAVIGDVAHPAWRARSVGIYRLWRDGGFAVGAVLSGVVADLWGVRAAVWTVAALTAVSGALVAARMYETRRHA